MPSAYRRAELPSVKGHFGISCLVLALVVQFSFHHTWSFLALVTAILLQRDVPLYVTWHNVSQMCPFIYKWKEFNFLSITCFHLYVCFVKGACTCYGTHVVVKEELEVSSFRLPCEFWRWSQIVSLRGKFSCSKSSQRPQNSIFSYEIIVFNYMYLD